MSEASRPLVPIQVEIRNCQSIESLDFEVYGFTCITGKSNIGKSSIIRSIASSLLNAPVGSLLRKGAKFCSVTLQSKDWGFKWEKGAGVSRYFIPADTITPLDKVGMGQIEPVIQMGFQSVSLGDKKSFPWYATQFKPLFLLTETGATVTDFISEVSRLQVLQEAITISVRGRKKALDEAKIRTADLDRLREKAKRVEGLNNLEKVARELEEQAESIREYERRVLLAEEAFRKLEASKAVLLAVEAIDRVKVPKDRIAEQFDRMRLMVQRQKELLAAAQKVIVLKASDKIQLPEMPQEEMQFLRKAQKYEGILRLRELVSILDAVDKVKLVSSDTGVLDDFKKLRRGVELQARLQSLTTSIKQTSIKFKVPEAPPDLLPLARMGFFARKIASTNADLEALELELQESRSKLAAVQSEIDKIPNCPTCNRVVSASHSAKSHKRTPSVGAS